jgi:YVTN family beta-propeller protein
MIGTLGASGLRVGGFVGDRRPRRRARVRLVALLAAALASAPAAAQPLAYVPIDGGAAIGVFDTATDTPVTTIPIITSRVVVNSTGTRVYSTSGIPGPGGVSVTISVIDTATNAVVATIPFTGFDQVTALALSSDDRRLYAGEFSPTPGPGRPYNSVAVFDTATNARLANVDVGPASPVFSYIRAIPADPMGLRTYVAVGSDARNSITVLERRCDEVATSIDLGSGSFNAFNALAIHPNGTRLYALDSTRFMAIDASSGAILAEIPFNNAAKLAVSPTGDRVYVSSFNDNTLYAIDTATHAVAASVFVPGRPSGVMVHPNGTKLYLAQANNAAILVLAPNDLRTLGSVTLGGTLPAVLPGQIASGVAGPGPADPAPPANVSITGIEVTQGIQDVANSVRLVRGRKAFARVYVKSNGPVVPNVTATLSGLGFVRTAVGTITLPLAGIAPINAIGPRLAVGPFPSRFDLDQSFLFELPWSWTGNSSMRIGATLGTNTQPPAQCARSLTGAQTLELATPTRIKPVFVRLRYVLPVSNFTAETTMAERAASISFMQRIFPVSNLDARDFYLFDGGLGSRVAQVSDDCLDMPAAERNLCARNYISQQLAALQAETGFMGDADMAYALIPQHPSAPFTRGACCTERVGGGPANDKDYAAHEIGHFIDRDHPVEGAAECDHSATDPAFPHHLSHIGPYLGGPVPADAATALAGFDTGDAALMIPRAHLWAGTAYDIMGYCRPEWISDYTYNGLYPSLLALSDIRDAGGAMGGVVINPGPAGPEPEPGDWLQAFGSVASDGTSASFMQVKRLASIVRMPERVAGPLSLRLVDAGGAVLATYPFAAQALDAGPGDENDPGSSFSLIVPFAAGARAIEVANTALPGAPTIAVEPVSANAPVVTRVALRTPPDPQTGIAALAWDASDADGDALAYDVRLVAEDGASPMPVLLGLAAREANVDTSPFAGGTVRLEVVASDGVLRGSAQSEPFTIAPKPPAPAILAPADGESVYVGQTLNLDGEASDAKDGKVAEAGLAWSADGAPIGTGARVSVADLAAGAHTLTLAATNSLGLSASTSIQIHVGEVPPTSRPALTAGPLQVGWHAAPGDLALRTAEVSAANAGDGTPLAFTVTTPAPWLQATASATTTPATITLTANPAGFAPGAFEETTVSIAAADPQAGAVSIAVSLAVGDTFGSGADADPLVTPPADVEVAATEAGGARSFASTALASFLAGGSAVDGTDPAPQRLAPRVGDAPVDPQTLFPVGTTAVTFRFQDASGNVGVAAAQVRVTPFSGPAVCDPDANGQIDRDDVAAIFAARGTAAGAGDPRDADGDGTISVLDASLCRAQCTHFRCRATAPENACGLGAEIALALGAIAACRRHRGTVARFEPERG